MKACRSCCQSQAYINPSQRQTIVVQPHLHAKYRHIHCAPTNSSFQQIRLSACGRHITLKVLGKQQDAEDTLRSTMSTAGAIRSTFIFTETAALYITIAARHLSIKSSPVLDSFTQHAWLLILSTFIMHCRVSSQGAILQYKGILQLVKCTMSHETCMTTQGQSSRIECYWEQDLCTSCYVRQQHGDAVIEQPENEDGVHPL